MKGRAQGYNKFQMENDQSGRIGTENRSRDTKRQIGTIAEIHPARLAVRIRLPTKDGSTRLFGQSPGAEVPFVPLSDDPLDLLFRYGGVEVGMVVEVFWRGLAESSVASAHIIGASQDEAKAVNLQQEHIDNTASSKPFEPGGLF